MDFDLWYGDRPTMRIATWNVNSLKARLERVRGWLDRVQPDVLLLQETKLKDADAPREVIEDAGYELAHHGEGGWNGVAIASRVGLDDVVTNFGEPLRAAVTEGAHDDEPFAEARMIAARCGGVRTVSLYAPNGRVVHSPFWRGKLVWFERLAKWVAEGEAGEPCVIGGDFNVAPADDDVWDPTACHGGTHVSPEERAAFHRVLDLGFVDAYRALHPERGRYSWWDYRAGAFHKNLGMRIDHLLVAQSLAPKVVFAEIDRAARKGTLPSDHAPVVVDLGERGVAFDAGWAGADERAAARRGK